MPQWFLELSSGVRVNLRRMADVAAHLVDEVFPEVPVRQWVCSLPWRLRDSHAGTIGQEWRTVPHSLH
ncbi:hypothetical protein DB30_02249 [Enhygromyxa salina]|uniref:Uncharacterized protein n=1 Tax=Enhygromyxa salina TaxID=215803 RepID=A0A0C1ZM32_9BACT|nr:hypothetical protein DB30_02249 [Enhygromyxa salina]